MRLLLPHPIQRGGSGFDDSITQYSRLILFSFVCLYAGEQRNRIEEQYDHEYEWFHHGELLANYRNGSISVASLYESGRRYCRDTDSVKNNFTVSRSDGGQA
jgi:hypothetical protein